MRKLAAGENFNEHGITFERQANGDAVFSVNDDGRWSAHPPGYRARMR
ncbi:MAG: hypothetical protein IPJ99_00365, partial [Betaproteobacteria bacterium]|nr:hypothetical protein [Betaproteobacteria bacterium]